jgi:spermidine synthase
MATPSPIQLEHVCTQFNDVRVMRTGDLVSFEISGAAHAEWRADRLLTRQAWDALAAAVLYHPAAEPSVLMLGLGGGTGARILRALRPAARITAVEIDGGMIALARKYMGLDALRLEVIEADAFYFLRTTQRRFDVVLDDLYLGGTDDTVRPARLDTPLVASLRSRLNPGGVLGVNLITGSGHRSIQSGARQTLRTAFAEVRSLVPPVGLNETLVAGDSLPASSPLRAAAPVFTHPEDKSAWAALRVRRLG